jgi:hypothetical protein
MESIEKQLRNCAATVYRKMFYNTRLDIIKTFPTFVADGVDTTYKQTVSLAIETNNQTIPLLNMLARSSGLNLLKPTSLENFPSGVSEREAGYKLRELFNKHGSDKSNFHNYECLYGTILNRNHKIEKVLEIGLGSNNTRVPSNMGAKGKPGASLRAFREFLPNAQIYGADIDKCILFREDRIQTFFVDQTDPGSLAELAINVSSDFDLIIDDGLHALNANISVLIFALDKIKPGGWIVIEDINEATAPAWELISAIIPNNYRLFLFKAKPSIFLFAMKKIS